MKPISTAFKSAALALLVAGCAHKSEVNPDPTPAPSPQAAAPAATPVPDAAAETPSDGPAAMHYVVRKGDSLWTIAAQSGVLGDPMRWPLLYKKNRDSIADPDLIDVDQDLSYSDHSPAADIAVAEKEAADTPPYVAHSTARKTLAINY
jgi:nucleoid-associated protein YgaU